MDWLKIKIIDAALNEIKLRKAECLALCLTIKMAVDLQSFSIDWQPF